MADGRWITTKKNHRHIFIPAGKDAGEVLKETFAKYNDDDYDYYEDGDDEEYKDFDSSYDEEFDDNAAKDFGYDEESKSDKNDINWNDLTEEDRDLFVDDLENSDVDFTIADVAEVKYTEPQGYDGGYEVTLKDGTKKNFGWYDEMYAKIYEIKDNEKKPLSDGGVVKNSKRHSESNEYGHTVSPEMLVKALNGDNVVASELMTVALKDFNENMNNGTLDREATVKHWKEDFLDKIDESKITNPDIKSKLKNIRDVVDHYYNQDERGYDSYEEYKKAWNDWRKENTINVYNDKGDMAEFYKNKNGKFTNGFLTFDSKEDLIKYVSKYGFSEK